MSISPITNENKMIASNIVIHAAQSANINIENMSLIEIESVVLKDQKARKELYKIQESIWAESVVQKVMEYGYFTLERPIPIPEPKIDQNLPHTQKRNLEVQADRTFKQNCKDKASYLGKLNAIKNYICENNIESIEWDEDESGFHIDLN
jgi:hypothetical protein